jgi:hypothetical protein
LGKFIHAEWVEGVIGAEVGDGVGLGVEVGVARERKQDRRRSFI